MYMCVCGEKMVCVCVLGRLCIQWYGDCVHTARRLEICRNSVYVIVAQNFPGKM